ncbi:unnamed protein product, partial [Rotaria socialis]
MGFSIEGCKKALVNTGNNSIEAAMNWVFEHQVDPDFDTPYLVSNKSSTPTADEESLGILMSMGVSRSHAIHA